MLVLHESAAAYKRTKPVVCLKCNRGKIGHIPEGSSAVLSKRGRIPSDGGDEYVLQVKCHVCRSFWTLTVDNY